MTMPREPVDWELDNTGLKFSDGISLKFPDPLGDCLLDVDQEYSYCVPYRALKQFVERVEDRNLNQGFKS